MQCCFQLRGGAVFSGLAGAFAYTLYSMTLKMSIHSALLDHCVVTKGRLAQQRNKWQFQSTDLVSHATDLCCTFEHQQLYLQTTLWHLRENTGAELLHVTLKVAWKSLTPLSLFLKADTNISLACYPAICNFDRRAKRKI